VKQYVISETFFKKIAEKGGFYSRIWVYWLANFVDEIFEPEFIEKQIFAYPDVSEIKEIYNFGVESLQQDFKVIGGKKKRIKKPVTKESLETARQIIDYLNSTAGTTFQLETGSNLQLISDRINEGYSISEFKVVIDSKVKDWKGTDWGKFLRPITLFNKQKFENYLNTNNEQSAPKNKYGKFADSVAQAKAALGIL